MRRMITKIIKVGNSKGIRLSKEILADIPQASGFIVKKSGKDIILTPIEFSRKNWETQMLSDSKRAPETTGFVENQFDAEEWEW